MKFVAISIPFVVIAVIGWYLAKVGPDRWAATPSSTSSISIIANVNTDENQEPGESSELEEHSSLKAPTNLTLKTQGTDKIILTWKAVDDAAAYQITRDGNFLAVVYGTIFVDSRVTPATTSYAYAVTSLDAQARTSTLASSTTSVPTSQVATNEPSSPSTPTKTTTTPSTNTSKNTTTTTNKNTSTPTTNKNTSTSTPSTPTTPTNTNTSTNTNSAPPPPPPPAAPACGQGGACTASQIASHSTRSNCWVYLSPINKVYNITAYVSSGSKHPGGDVIVPYCGQNIYAYFIGNSGGHAHSSKALNSTLQAYYIGPYQP